MVAGTVPFCFAENLIFLFAPSKLLALRGKIMKDVSENSDEVVLRNHAYL